MSALCTQPFFHLSLLGLLRASVFVLAHLFYVFAIRDLFASLHR